jgi:hypothetical protein
MSKTQNDSDAVGFLLNSAGKFPMLTGDQEIELGRQVQAMMRLQELPENERPEDWPVIVRRGQQQFQIQRYISVSAFLLEIILNRYIRFNGIDKTELM